MKSVKQSLGQTYFRISVRIKSVEGFVGLKNQSGQLVIEYVLLLILTVSIAALTLSLVGSRGGTPGFLVKKWNDILQVIGSDDPNR